MEQVTVLARLTGRRSIPIRCVVDTGASITVVPKSVAQLIGLVGGETKHAEVADGWKVRLNLANLTVEIPALRCSGKVKCGVVDADVDVLIGSDFLQKKGIRIDYRDHALVYKGKKHKMLFAY